MPELIYRETDIVSLGQLGQEFIHPERLRIQLDSIARKAPIDIGAFAYSRRDCSGNHVAASKPISVDPESFIPARRDLIRNIIDYFFISGSRDKSILTEFKKLKVVMDWCDSNGHYRWLENIDEGSKAYIAFSDFLKHEVLAMGTLSPRTCAHRQQAFQKLLELVFRADAIHAIKHVPTISVHRNPPEPPIERDVKRYVSVCLDIAKNFSDFVVEGREFPFKASIGGIDVVVFPSGKGIKTPYTPEEKFAPSYNAEELRIATKEEYMAKTGYSPSVSVRALEEAQENVDAANVVLRHEQRMRLASMAASAYACLFVLITAANPSEFLQFEHLDALEIEKSMVKKELTSIKFRANGKSTRYAIGRRTGIHLLRDYLKLREWILNGNECPYLFFKMQRTGGYTGTYCQLTEAFSSTFFKRISGIFLPSEFKNIPGSLARKLKSLVLHELRVSPSVVADVLNHTQTTNASSYSETTPDRLKHEFGVFWESVRSAASVVRERALDSTTGIAAGHCADFRNPTKIITSVPIEPDCRSQYGCLYCEHYVCHADEEDTHKLLSLQYVANAVRSGASDISYAEELFKELSIRIEFILQSISERSETSALLVNNLRNRVQELGELTNFWESRLQRYEAMGVVF
ncbi:hypothetical protein [uncultured Pseudomonas sp.]|uniref:hypothetical protein n=1 Tax=uncultured Pseudomonas sp. TaxID=114707 RepID=UPI0030DD72EB|tara:strand:+ start:1811 stop:3712 length:1902 start_codon:yes stop_codon:yes gene_type:complete